MNEQSDTPRTDVEHKIFPMGGFTLDFARQLERELIAATERLKANGKTFYLKTAIVELELLGANAKSAAAGGERKDYGKSK